MGGRTELLDRAHLIAGRGRSFYGVQVISGAQMNRSVLRALALPVLAAAALGGCGHMGHPKVLPSTACSDTTVTLYFGPGEDNLDPTGREIVREASRRLKGCPVQELTILGLADPEGQAQANLELSKRRAEHVRDAFLRDGLPVQRFTLAANGDVGAVRPSGVVEPVRRRVDVTVVMRR